jgi:hypothetical protein
MMTIDRWSGRESRLLRHALRLTVRAFAEDLGVCVRTVSKWEAIGPAVTPRPELQAALDTMLRRCTDEDRARFRAALSAASSGSPAGVGGVAGAGGMGAAGGPARIIALDADPDDDPQVVAALADARRYLDGAMVVYFRRRLMLLKLDDGRLGPGVVLPLLLGMLGAITGHAAEVGPDLRRDLLAVGADSAAFAGQLYQDAHDLTRSQYWRNQATEWEYLAARPVPAQIPVGHSPGREL